MPECSSRSPLSDVQLDATRPRSPVVIAGRWASTMCPSKTMRRGELTLDRGQVVDDRVAADLLLAVAQHPHVDGQLAGRGQVERRPSRA